MNMKKIIEYSSKEELVDAFTKHFEEMRDEKDALLFIYSEGKESEMSELTVKGHGKVARFFEMLVHCCEDNEQILYFFRTVVAYFDDKKGA